VEVSGKLSGELSVVTGWKALGSSEEALWEALWGHGLCRWAVQVGCFGRVIGKNVGRRRRKEDNEQTNGKQKDSEAAFCGPTAFCGYD